MEIMLITAPEVHASPCLENCLPYKSETESDVTVQKPNEPVYQQKSSLRAGSCTSVRRSSFLGKPFMHVKHIAGNGKWCLKNRTAGMLTLMEISS
jgi:hypothetical protein